MADIERADAIRGTTMRWIWTDGPTRGESYEHRFSEDGTVTWRNVKAEASERTETKANGKGRESATYAANRLSDEMYLVSYHAPSGYTLTVAVDFRDRRLVGFASNSEQWFPVRGTFELGS
jgi:hypothetical protein